jgi:hypothetical protein
VFSDRTPPLVRYLINVVNLPDGQLPADAAVWLRAAGTTSYPRPSLSYSV